MTNTTIKIGTRGSKLALYQANKVKNTLAKQFPDRNFEIEIIHTKGDKILDVALSKIGDKGLFTKEIETSLLNGNVDLAVHSLKDLPTNLPDGLCLGGVLERAEFCDALVSIDGKKIAELTKDDVIATSSLRRKAQLLLINPDFKIVDIRGNVDTRLRKMKEGHCTAMIMAAAGLQRLGYHDSISEVIEPELIIPAVSQGAIAIEIRENDSVISPLIDAINHQSTLQAVKAERVFLNVLEGGCQIPIGCYSKIDGNKFSITGFVSDIDGSNVIKERAEGHTNQAEEVAKKLALSFIEKGADKILNKIRETNL